MEFKEVASYLGFKEDEFKTIEEFKSKFDSEFLRTSAITEDSEPVKKILGKTFGTLENEIKKVAKAHDLDIDFEADDLKGKKVTDKLKFTFSKYDEKKQSIIKELETKAGQGNDEKVKEWETKYGKLENKYKDVDGLLKQTTSDFNGFKEQSEKTIKGVKLNIHKKDLYGKAKFLPEVNEYTKKGFLNEFEEKYMLDIDENEKPVILDKKGQRIPNPKVTGSFYEPDELLMEETIKAKLFPVNSDGGKKIVPVNFGQAGQQQQTTIRKVAPRLG
jgi:hypothetical protein